MHSTNKLQVKKIKNETQLIYINTLTPNFNFKNRVGKLHPIVKNCVNL
jgi:hypothetical protein